MTDYAVFANARVLAHIKTGELAARPGTAAADALRRMTPGDQVIPLFDAEPAHGADELQAIGDLAAELPIDESDILRAYEGVAGTVPYILTVTKRSQEGSIGSSAYIFVEVRTEQLPSPVDSTDFLRLRTLSSATASQFKGAAPARPIQEVPHSLVSSVRAAGAADRDEAALFRRFSLVEGQSPETAASLLRVAGRELRDGDEVFLVTRATMPGLITAGIGGQLGEPQQPIARTPEEIKALLIDAQRKATPADPFNADAAIAATDELIGLLNGEEQVKPLDDFGAFYEFRLLSRAVTQAIELAKRPLPADQPVESHDQVAAEEDGAAAALQGLSVEAVLAQLPEGFSIDRSVIAAAVASLRAGKHLLLGGPPGSGKTTVAEALCRAVVGSNYDVTTATADWTTFDTIGGYLPDSDGLKFVPGVVLRSLRGAGWLIIDEVNRADIDKAFGPLFTVLSGGEGSAGRTSVLPYMTSDGKPVTVEWATTNTTPDGVYPITPWWRLLGTLNVSDKASLFRLSFAFLRRFAVIDVPLPPEDEYRKLFARWFGAGGGESASLLVDLAMVLVTGPVPIGPAIGRDFSQLVIEGLTETASGTPTFVDGLEAVLTAARLLVVPQYEGQPVTAGEQLLARIDEAVDTKDTPARIRLEVALREVALS